MDRFDELFSKYDFTNLEPGLITQQAESIIADNIKLYNQKSVYSNILSCIDLTSLNSDDTISKITSLVDLVNGFDDEFEILPHPAAICVYPSYISTVKDNLQEDVEIATVVGFPHSNTFLEVKIAEVGMSIMEGATEIDVVMPLGLFCSRCYSEVYDELSEIKLACQGAKLKVILETGVLEDPVLIKKASIIAMAAGADFIKTSTGKSSKGATFEAVYVMAQTIKEFNELNNQKVGLKVAGGVSDTMTAIKYYTLVSTILGDEWMNSSLFRIGTSKLINRLLSDLSGREISYF
ncbi:MAG: deoxyribose-phosphate aldolase [Paludibacteraceae bacterium]|nr:deoxyribose-phosphate aldolase [Paludibacteraceae bacterium]MEE3483732.1 deoxyribose-phosphate aldolase [Bacteroidales bacterium]